MDLDANLLATTENRAPERPVRRRRGGGPLPLSAEEAARCDQVAARVQAELRRLIGKLPESARSASGMARHLGIVRNTCQRVVTATAEASAGAGLLVKMPGVEGLRQFVEAVAARGVDPAEVAGARAAVEQFQGLLRELGGSQSRLAERLRAGEERPEAAGESALGGEAARRQLFVGAVRCTGQQCATSVSLMIFRPRPDDDAVRQRVLVQGVLGYRAHVRGLPLVLSSLVSLDNQGRGRAPSLALLDSTPAHGSGGGIVLERFSSRPLPLATVRQDDGQLFTILDQQAAGDDAIDVMIAERGEHRPTDADLKGRPLRDMWTLVNIPSRALVFDVYLHQSMAAGCVPSVDAVAWSPRVESPHRWAGRLPSRPRLELLGRGLSGAASEHAPLHSAMTAEVFGELGWDADHFVGYRCEVSYPVWRTGYFMSFHRLSE